MVKSVVFLLALFDKAAFDLFSEDDLIDRLKEIN
jgi:hypothetical protein